MTMIGLLIRFYMTAKKAWPSVLLGWKASRKARMLEAQAIWLKPPSTQIPPPKLERTIAMLIHHRDSATVGLIADHAGVNF